jgi:glutamate synthase domain-containing protein 2/glutamate synthase domain-containing protein 1/glutamate synthase domain-containing protein 3
MIIIEILDCTSTAFPPYSCHMSEWGADHDACGVGLIAQMGGKASHEIVERGLEALLRLAHRGGVDADGRSGDGAGLLLPIPEEFFRSWAKLADLELPPTFGLGMAFLPSDSAEIARRGIEDSAVANGLRCLGSRTVPTDASILGPRALETLPLIEQFFFAGLDGASSEELEKRLFRMRKQAEAIFPPGAYFCSLSSKTVVYKGLVTPDQLRAFYRDLSDPGFQCWFAIFHQRYSTNTQPSWALAQPFRFAAHNGEINTISANRRWLRARQASWRQCLELPRYVRLLEHGVSDSASLDNAFELHLRRGYSLAGAILRMVPPAWQDEGAHVPPQVCHYLAAQAHRQEPWDGPAALVFTDGNGVGAKLDRNGLRPLRYTLTADGLLVVGSETGIADLQGKRVVERQRLGPGELLLLLKDGKLLRPGQWPELPEEERHSCDHPLRIAAGTVVEETATRPSTRVMAALGWTEDRFRLLFQPLMQEGREAVWSMGDDAPPAFLSSHRRPLWDYCKQRFAQVTNPSIDPLRERQVMSLEVHLGESSVLSSPLLDSSQLQAMAERHAPAHRIDFTFPASEGVQGALAALARIGEEARQAAEGRAGVLILSDRAIGAERAPLPALLATAAVWKFMVQAGGWEVPLVVESGQVVETHHLALLAAAGASAVLPWLALAVAAQTEHGAANFRTAVENGLRKVMARMGVSAMASYRNSRLFEIVGLDADICERFFEDAHCALGGKNLSELLQDALETHAAAFASEKGELRDAGLYRFRHRGETHGNSPDVVRRIHQYIKTPGEKTYQEFAAAGEDRGTATIRDLLEIVPAAAPVTHAHVESEASILSRFSTQAMSLGAISPEAHRTLAIAMNRLGARSNTGEGGEDPRVYRHGGGNNRVKQVASARFGVTTEYLVNADELEIKIAQGAKPGEGGQLPASKVTAYIARLRHAVPNMTLISPPPHHDIYSIEDLAQLIYDLRAVNPHARIGVKLVASGGVGMIATGVAKAGADVITISGHDGGTGASPMTSIKNTGLPWEVGLRDAHCSLVRAGLRGRVRLRVDGGLKFARDVIIAALLGAEEFGFATAALLAMGCVMARQCHLNTCPVGIATQDDKLRTRFSGKPEMVMQYFRALAADVQQLLVKLGAPSVDEIVGAVERLRPGNPEAERALGSLLEPVQGPAQPACPREDTSRLHRELLPAGDGIGQRHARRRFRIANCDRAIGAHLSGELARRGEGAGIAPLRYEFVGTAGQSFGAFLSSGVHFRLLGEANDYVGKGLSGGTIVVTHGPEASRRGDVLAGNTVLYGSTAGELYVAGRAGERFAVRNSGALAVVEGAGQHCCEYMTAGVVLVLGPAGANLGAGMTGGLAYVLRDSAAAQVCNRESVLLAEVEMTERRWLRRVLRNHVRLTGSPRAMRLLSDFNLPLFRVEPLQRPCTVAETWAPILERLHQQEAAVPGAAWIIPAQEPLPN